jgi:DNA anti-recombination protein RmuC
MPKSKKLQNKISKKFDQLQTLIDEINEVQNLNSDDPET